MKIGRSTSSTLVIALALTSAAIAVAAPGGGGTPTPTPTPAPAPVVVAAAPASSPVAVPSTTAANGGAAATPAGVALQPFQKALPGVNISGGEFGTVPGRLNYQYIYPSSAEIDSFYNKGFKVLRIPFRWERLQPTLYGVLAKADRAALKAATTYATAKGMTVILDMHDYAHRHVVPGTGANAVVGTAELPVAALADAWRQIADDYRDNPKVWLGLMNEPSGLGVANWWGSVQLLVNDLRAQRVANKLLVPGGSWTGAHSWASSGNAAQAEAFVDPGNDICAVSAVADKRYA